MCTVIDARCDGSEAGADVPAGPVVDVDVARSAGAVGVLPDGDDVARGWGGEG